jgi:putative endonuclease
LYVGVAGNVDERLKRHKSGFDAEFTKRNKVEKVVYTEEYKTYLEVRRREKQIKGWTRLKKENLIKYGKPLLTC